jgi:hypothetical protein
MSSHFFEPGRRNAKALCFSAENEVSQKMKAKGKLIK